MFPFVFKNRKAIGGYPIFENIKEQDRASTKLAVNYDFTREGGGLGHSAYGPLCGQFLPKVKDCYWNIRVNFGIK